MKGAVGLRCQDRERLQTERLEMLREKRRGKTWNGRDPDGGGDPADVAFDQARRGLHLRQTIVVDVGELVLHDQARPDGQVTEQAYREAGKNERDDLEADWKFHPLDVSEFQ